MDPQELLLIAFRSTIVYFAVLIVIRILGKREVGSLTAFDLVVSLIIGEGVDEAIYGDVTMAKFLVLLVTIAVWEAVNSYVSYKNRTFEKLTSAQPTVVIEHGKLKEGDMARERLTEDELWSGLREQGVDDLKEVKRATIEPSGAISVLLEDWAKPLQKSDLPAVAKK
ncbi:MAG TPA: DUF421 domain-containing protein [Anaerolineaceae bacterium]